MVIRKIQRHLRRRGGVIAMTAAALLGTVPWIKLGIDGLLCLADVAGFTHGDSGEKVVLLLQSIYGYLSQVPIVGRQDFQVSLVLMTGTIFVVGFISYVADALAERRDRTKAKNASGSLAGGMANPNAFRPDFEVCIEAAQTTPHSATDAAPQKPLEIQYDPKRDFIDLGSGRFHAFVRLKNNLPLPIYDVYAKISAIVPRKMTNAALHPARLVGSCFLMEGRRYGGSAERPEYRIPANDFIRFNVIDAQEAIMVFNCSRGDGVVPGGAYDVTIAVFSSAGTDEQCFRISQNKRGAVTFRKIGPTVRPRAKGGGEGSE